VSEKNGEKAANKDGVLGIHGAAPLTGKPENHWYSQGLKVRRNRVVTQKGWKKGDQRYGSMSDYKSEC